MQLQTGKIAPSFQTQDIFEQPITIGSPSQHWTLISFLRNGACALCNLRIHTMIGHYQEFKNLGLEVIAIFESPTESIRQNVTKQNVPFTLIGDPEAKLYELYGVQTSEEITLIAS